MRLGLLSYINSLPATFAIESGQLEHDCTLLRAEPSELNRLAIAGDLDVTAVSSVEYLRNRNLFELVPELCLGSDGPVRSVRLFSTVALEQLRGQTVWMTGASATSRALLLSLVPGVTALDAPGEPSLDGRAAAVLRIGDRALEEVAGADHVYDLGELWQQTTGLPMVFAVWVARRGFLARASRLLAESLAWGRANHDRVLDEAMARTGLSRDRLTDYFQCLSFTFDERARQGLEEFGRRALVKERV